MLRVAKGHIEQLPSGSFRVSVYSGTDPLTRRAIRLKSTVKTEQQAHIELGASQLLAGGLDLRNTAARLGHSGGGATNLRHYADPVPEVDWRAAAYANLNQIRSSELLTLTEPRARGRADDQRRHGRDGRAVRVTEAYICDGDNDDRTRRCPGKRYASV